MADYYPVLVRAVSRLPDNNAQARHEIYERARAIVLEELRKQDPKKLPAERAQLEAAISRLESECAARERPLARAPARPTAAASRGAQAPVAAPKRTTRSYLARIFSSPRPVQPPQPKPKPQPPAQPRQAAGGIRKAATDELGGMLNSLGTMLFGTAFLVAVLAITGVVYVRGLIWVDAGLISYPVLLVLTAIVFFLLIIVPRAMFHNASAWSAFGFLSRFLYSTSRRVF